MIDILIALFLLSLISGIGYVCFTLYYHTKTIENFYNGKYKKPLNDELLNLEDKSENGLINKLVYIADGSELISKYINVVHKIVGQKETFIVLYISDIIKSNIPNSFFNRLVKSLNYNNKYVECIRYKPNNTVCEYYINSQKRDVNIFLDKQTANDFISDSLRQKGEFLLNKSNKLLKG